MSGLRRYGPMKPSRGTAIPSDVRRAVMERDRICVATRLAIPHVCDTPLELDHVRKGGMGMKSRSTPDNLVALCARAHRAKTEDGRLWRVALLEYLATFEEKAA